MTILLQIDIFYLIFQNLSLKEIIRLRAVCSQWREWIDAHLKRQKVLLLEDNDSNFHTALSSVSQTLDINYAQIVSSKLVIREKNFELKSFGSSLVRTFPNLEELYIFVDPDIEYGNFIPGLKRTLKKLIVDHLNEEHSNSYEGSPPGLFDCLVECDKLVTFGIHRELVTENTFLSGDDNHCTFLDRSIDRLTSLLLPTLSFINEYSIRIFDVFPNVTGATSDYWKDRMTKTQFPSIKRIFRKISFEHQCRNVGIYEEFEKLAELEHENLCCLEFNFETSMKPWPEVVEFQETRFLPFFDQMNRFPSVKTLKIETQHPVLMEYILRNCAHFDHIETFIINFVRYFRYPNWEKVHLPTNFEELLPLEMNRIQNLVIYAEKENFETLKQMDFSRLPYKVKIMFIS